MKSRWMAAFGLALSLCAVTASAQTPPAKTLRLQGEAPSATDPAPKVFIIDAQGVIGHCFSPAAGLADPSKKAADAVREQRPSFNRLTIRCTALKSMRVSPSFRKHC